MSSPPLGAGGEALRVPSVEVGSVLARLDRGEPLLLLDVRNEEDFARWRLEAARAGRGRARALLRVPRGPGRLDRAAAAQPRGGRPLRPRRLLRAGRRGSCSRPACPPRTCSGGMEAYGCHLEAGHGARSRPRRRSRFSLWQVNRRGKGCLSYVDRLRVGGCGRGPEPRRGLVRGLRGRPRRADRPRARHARARGPRERRARARATAPASRTSWTPARASTCARVVARLADGERLRLGGPGGVELEVRVMHTPGHTPGSASYLLDGRYLLSGDTLFVGSVGRPDLGGHVEEWGRALFDTVSRRLAALPPDTVVLPAHYAGVGEIGPDGVVAGRLGGSAAPSPSCAPPRRRRSWPRCAPRSQSRRRPTPRSSA